MAWYYFDQNNSGGIFHHDPSKGIGFGLFIEAESAELANARAEDIGLYFDGNGDCECCGNRWSSALQSDGTDVPKRYGEEWIAAQNKDLADQEFGINLYIHPSNSKLSVATRKKED